MVGGGAKVRFEYARVAVLLFFHDFVLSPTHHHHHPPPHPNDVCRENNATCTNPQEKEAQAGTTAAVFPWKCGVDEVP